MILRSIRLSRSLLFAAALPIAAMAQAAGPDGMVSPTAAQSVLATFRANASKLDASATGIQARGKHICVARDAHDDCARGYWDLEKAQRGIVSHVDIIVFPFLPKAGSAATKVAVVDASEPRRLLGVFSASNIEFCISEGRLMIDIPHNGGGTSRATSTDTLTTYEIRTGRLHAIKRVTS